MWYEYVIIFAGVALAAGYVLWMFTRSFRAKGNCCGSSCAAPSADEKNDRRLRAVPLVKLGASQSQSQSQSQDTTKR